MIDSTKDIFITYRKIKYRFDCDYFSEFGTIVEETPVH